jgi:thymidine phosphorylase
LDKQEAEKERDTDMSLATAVEVLDDLRALIGQSVEIRDQLQALTRREAPKFLEQLCKHLGHSSEEVVAAVAKAREECRIDLDEYRLQHAPEVQRKMKEQFDIDVKPGKD